MTLQSNDGLSQSNANLICESEGLEGLELIDGQWWAVDCFDGERHNLTQNLFDEMRQMGEIS